MKATAVQIYSKTDIAAKSGLSLSTIYNDIRDGLLNSAIGNGFSDSDVIDWLQTRSIGASLSNKALRPKAAQWLAEYEAQEHPEPVVTECIR